MGAPEDFPREPKIATYCGVTPLTRKSGISQGSSHLSRFTNRRLLRAIFQATVSAIRRDPRSQEYYQTKLEGRTDPLSKTRAQLALARHRTRRLYKILRECASEPAPRPPEAPSLVASKAEGSADCFACSA